MRSSKATPADPWSCARAMLGRWLATGEVSATADEISTNFLTQVALAEGLAGLLYDTVHEETAPWPDAACTMLRNAVEEDFTRGARQLETARRVQQLLVSRGVRALPLKGAAVAERLYDSVTHRSMLDVDLLVLDDWPRAVTLLKEAGFRPEREADHAQAFVDPALGTVLELHRVITSCGSLFPLDRDGLWMRSRAGVGLVTRVPSTEDLLVQLSLHAAFQHGLRLRLVQFLDFRRLLEREPPDLAVLYRVATDAGAQRAVGVAVEAARVAVGAPIGRDLEELVAEWLPKKLRRAAASTDGTPALPWLRWQLADGRRLQLVRETLSPRCSTPGGERRGRAARALGLARRWAAPALRSFSS